MEMIANQPLSVLHSTRERMAFAPPIRPLTDRVLEAHRMAGDITPQLRPIVTCSEAKALGAKQYFTGKPCPSGHVANRYTDKGGCVECDNQKKRAKRQLAAATREISARTKAAIASDATYYTGKPCINGHVSERYTKTGACLVCVRVYADANVSRRKAEDPEAFASLGRERSARWRARHPEQSLAITQAWIAKNPERHRSLKKAGNRNRKARLRSIEGTHTAGDIADILHLQRGRCALPICRKKLGDIYQVDHIMPVALGGTNDRRNIQLLCPKCNRKKHAKHPIAFAQEMGMLI